MNDKLNNYTIQHLIYMTLKSSSINLKSSSVNFIQWWNSINFSVYKWSMDIYIL